jgi:hypothetical protein
MNNNPPPGAIPFRVQAAGAAAVPGIPPLVVRWLKFVVALFILTLITFFVQDMVAQMFAPRRAHRPPAPAHSTYVPAPAHASAPAHTTLRPLTEELLPPLLSARRRTLTRARGVVALPPWPHELGQWRLAGGVLIAQGPVIIIGGPPQVEYGLAAEGREERAPKAAAGASSAATTTRTKRRAGRRCASGRRGGRGWRGRRDQAEEEEEVVYESEGSPESERSEEEEEEEEEERSEEEFLGASRAPTRGRPYRRSH